MRLALGTVQFGLAYGVANKSGQINSADASEILQRAHAAGIDTLDTAIAYGESEAMLGAVGVDQWKVVSKLPALPANCDDIVSWVRSEVADSLARLKIPKLHALLLHRSQDLLTTHGDVLYSALTELKIDGLVAKVGLSIYGPEELELVYTKFPLDLVQSPFNVFDRRLLNSGWLDRLHHAGTEVHVRSVFLQGLLLLPAKERQAEFAPWQDLWSKWDSWLRGKELTPLQASLIFALSRPEIDRVVVGVDGVSHLAEILSVPTTDPIYFPNSLESSDLSLINPTKWRQQ
jgi:aryl-alcohol dehydrogenase-like predicted oxidoreductase